MSTQYVPAGQGTGDAPPPAHAYPAEQGTQFSCAEVGSLYLPPVHEEVHAAWPGPENKPWGQACAAMLPNTQNDSGNCTKQNRMEG